MTYSNYETKTVLKQSLQCYSDLSDIWSKLSYAYCWKTDQMFYLLVKVLFDYLLPVSLIELCLSVLSTKVNFVQWYSVLSDLHQRTINDLCQVTKYVVLSAKKTYLREIGQFRSYLPYVNCT